MTLATSGAGGVVYFRASVDFYPTQRQIRELCESDLDAFFDSE